jgi:hypothetical protein
MLPHERELVERLKNKPFALIGINTDSARSWEQRSKADPIAWRNALDGSTSGRLCRAWRVTSFPTIYVLDGKGVIRFTGVRGAEMDKAVDELLGELDKQPKAAEKASNKPTKQP